MRTIKFRGKDINGKWHYGDLLNMTEKDEDTGELIKGCAIVSLGINECIEEPRKNVAVEIYDSEIAIVKTDSVGQFTGLTDKNGIEIYEGDKVKFTIRKQIYANDEDDWDEDYLMDQDLIVCIDNGIVMFGEYKCDYHDSLIEELFNEYMCNEFNIGCTDIYEYCDIENNGELDDIEYVYENSSISDIFENIVRNRLKLEVIGNIHDD